MADIQHGEIDKDHAHAAFRHVEATIANYATQIGTDHAADAIGLLAFQSDIKRVQYLSTPGVTPTWTTLLPGYTVTGAAPTATDDVDDGYEPGHQWIDTAGGGIYVCRSNAATAAVWDEINKVVAVAASADNRLARYDGTDGFQGSGITVDDSNNISGVVGLTATGDITLGIGQKIILDDDLDTYIWVAATDDRWAIYAGGVPQISFNGTALAFRRSLIANTTNTYDLGGASNRWRHLYISGDIDHSGSNIGFFGTTPAAQSSAYTLPGFTPDRDLSGSPSTTELKDVLATLISDLQSYGLLG